MNLNQHPALPSTPRPIVAIGAGGIMRHAHLPAYQMCGWTVQAVYDPNAETAHALAADFGIPEVWSSIEHRDDVVYDLATPASAVVEVLEQLPDEAFVLIQKPMGETLEQATQILDVCRRKRLNAAVNFQLRTAPYSLAVRDLMESGRLGEILEVDVKVWVHTPWAQWYFLELSPRMEVVYHSIHYVDFIRCLLGDPKAVKANTIRHPASPKLHSSRSAVLLDYGPDTRAQIVTYHAHDRGPKHQQSEFRIEGTLGSAIFRMGLNMNYPDGEPDFLEVRLNGMSDWETIPLEGSWFPHAFRGTMAAMQRWAEGGPVPESHVGDAYRTMQVVEAIYRDAERLGTQIDPAPASDPAN